MKNIIVSLILMALCGVHGWSQSASEMRIDGKPEFRPDELIGKEIVDANAAVCAGLIIVSDLNGLSYESNNGIVKLTQKPGSDFLFLSPSERVVTVRGIGFTPLQIILNEHGIKLESGRTWQLKITGDKKAELVPVNIQVEPAVDEILVDGKKGNVSAPFQLAPGLHTVRIEKNGFRKVEEDIDVSTTKTLFKFSLSEIELVGVKIGSVPPGARIIIDNSARGETDKSLFFFPGTYTLKLVKSGYVDVQRTIEVRENGSNTFIETLARNTGRLVLRVTPPDARVTIDKEDHTYNTEAELVAGKHQIEIVKSGFKGIKEIITIVAGTTLEKQYTLGGRTGSLQLTVQPEDAQIRLLVNGQEMRQWSGGRTLQEIAIGEYDLEVSARDCETLRKRIAIVEGRPREEIITLRKTQGEGTR